MIRVGPAGWSYPDWDGIVYPRRRPKGFHPLKQLARWFDCVEINSTFYAEPNAANAEHWAELVADRPRFRFTAKLQRIFTHELGSSATAAAVRAFHAGLQPLDDAHRLAAVLVQFPRSFRRDAAGEERLRWISETFGGWPLVLELRDCSWFAPEPLAAVRALGFTLCGIDLPAEADRPDEEALVGAGERGTRTLAYLRLHGRNARAWFDPRAGRDQKYDYLYAPDELREIADATRRLAHGAEETFVVTNNHFSGKAVANALELLALLGNDAVLGPVELLDAYPRLRKCVRTEGQDTLFAG